jgi:sugar phosphate isomerase/epimerase
MTTRRDFLQTIAGGLGVGALGAPRQAAAAGRPPIGLQLYSLRHQLQKDVPGTLAKVKAMGFEDVETAGTYGMSVADFAAALRQAGLRARAAHFPYEQFRDDAAGVVRDAQALGASFMVCAWIPHQGAFSSEHVKGAAAVFGGAARAGKPQGLRFAYHLHGYEFVAAPGGTLFDALVAQTANDGVNFEVDVLWAKAGGADPGKLIEKLAGRVPLTHLKDMRKGTQYTPPVASLPDDTNVVLGTGLLDFPAILKASEKAGVEIHFLEDEHPESIAQLPRSLAYLRTIAG